MCYYNVCVLCVCVSRVNGLSLRPEKMSDLKDEGEDTSPVSSGLSLKSERSMGLPITFSNEPGPSDTK